MGSYANFVKKCSLDHDFRDLCCFSHHQVAFSACHLNEIIEGFELYKEPYNKEKVKTLTVALVICLNIDINPPDVEKIPPYSCIQAWFDPTDASTFRALESIGKNLQAQYERWQPKARFKQCLDPTLDDIKKLCITLRRNAKEDRILFHYNGHGVPRPTESGEIWVFNKNFTKYIPLSLFDLQRWLGAPSVYVIDCQNAGRVIKMYAAFCQRRKGEMQSNIDSCSKKEAGDSSMTDLVSGCVSSNQTCQPGVNHNSVRQGFAATSLPVFPAVTMENTIMLAACQETEDLPQHPDLPADLFTSCLTTPIRTALKWHWLQYRERFPGYIDESLLDRIPGCHTNRMSLLGEINWIFTAVTDTIAWCSFSGDIFQKLFRQDLLVASLYRNFLLAERVMRTYGCHPCSWPRLKPTHEHPMWLAWDHSLDRFLHYLPQALRVLEPNVQTELSLPIVECPVLEKSDGATDTPSKLIELTDENRRKIMHLLSQSAKQEMTHEIPPPGYANRRMSQDRSPKSGKTMQCGKSFDKNIETEQSNFNKMTLSKISQSSIHDPTQSDVTIPESAGPRPKFLIEPSTPQDISVDTASSECRRGGFTLSRISEESSNNERPILRKSFSNTRLHNHAESFVDEQVPVVKNLAEADDSSIVDLPETEESSDASEDDDEAEYDGEQDYSGAPSDEEAERSDRIKSQLNFPVNSSKEKTSEEVVSQKLSSNDANPVNNKLLKNSNKFSISLSTEAVDQEKEPPVLTVEGNMQHRSPVTSDSKNNPASNYSKCMPENKRTQITSNAQNLEPNKTSAPVAAAPIRYPALPAANATRCSDLTPMKNESSGPIPKLSQSSSATPSTQKTHPLISLPAVLPISNIPTFLPASFFTSQMTAFKSWLCASHEQHQTATQLPILLQVLLSQSHRFRALQLLSEFLDLGPWAVSHCLTVGILPYIARLFHSNVVEIKPQLVFIWGKIIASAQTDFCRNEVVREHGYRYFTSCLRDSSNLSPLVRTMAVFVLAKMLDKETAGVHFSFFQEIFYKHNFIPIAIEALQAIQPTDGRSESIYLRLWLILALARLWYQNDNARWCGVRHGVHEVLYDYLHDVSPEVRGATVFAMGTFINNYPSNAQDDAQALELSHQVAAQLIVMSTGDASPLVRRELVAVFLALILQFEPQIIATAYQRWTTLQSSRQSSTLSTELQVAIITGSPSSNAPGSFLRNVGELASSKLTRSLSRSQTFNLDHFSSTKLPTPSKTITFPKPAPVAPCTNIYVQLWSALISLASDPSPTVADSARHIFLYIIEKIIKRQHLDKCVFISDGVIHIDDSSTEIGSMTMQNNGSPIQHSPTKFQLVGSPQCSFTSISSSSAIIHSAQFPGRRTGHTDLLIRQMPRTAIDKLTELESSSEILSSTNSRQSTSRLIEHVMTHFFAWASRWFTQPLLKRFPTALDIVTEANLNTNDDLRYRCQASSSAAEKDLYLDPQFEKTFSRKEIRASNTINPCEFGRSRWHAITTLTKPKINSHATETALNLSEVASSEHFSNDKPQQMDCSVDVIDRVHEEHGKPALDLSLLQIFRSTSNCPPKVILFHPYKPHVVVATDMGVSVFGIGSTERSENLFASGNFSGSEEAELSDVLAHEICVGQRFSSGDSVTLLKARKRGDDVTDMELLNSEEERDLVLTSSRDGTIRVWKYNYHLHRNPPELLTAWRGLSDVIPVDSRISSGVVTHWSHCSCQLTLAGVCRYVRIWETSQEARLRDIYTDSDTPVTKLARSQDDNLLATGFADGTIRLFDVRAPSSESQIFRGSVDSARILDIAFSPGDRIHAISSSGSIGAWKISGSRGKLPFENGHNLPRKTSFLGENPEHIPSLSSFRLSTVSTGRTLVCNPLKRISSSSSFNVSSPSEILTCATFLTSLPCTQSHIIASASMFRQLSVTRLCDRATLGIYKPSELGQSPNTPTCTAFHPFDSKIALGMSDSSVHLLQLRHAS